MLRLLGVVAFSLLAGRAVQAAPADNAQHVKRQDYAALLELASSAGITLPTDNPALLLSLAPIAGQLASYLPTAPVLSALQTAAPTDFLSKIVHDPSYARSFEEQFAQGSSPSWFLGLPSSVQNYLHTYSDYGGLVTEVGNAESILATAAATADIDTAVTTNTAEIPNTNDTLLSATPASTGSSNSTVGNASESGAISSAVTASQSSQTAQSTESSSESEASDTGTTSSEEASTAASEASASASTGAAPRETGVVAISVVAAAGMIGLAIAL